MSSFKSAKTKLRLKCNWLLKNYLSNYNFKLLYLRKEKKDDYLKYKNKNL